MTTEIIKEIDVLIRARYPILYIVSYEEERVEGVLADVAQRRQKLVYTWSIASGFAQRGLQGKPSASGDPLQPLDQLKEVRDPALFIFKDYHPYLSDHSVVRKLREVASLLQQTTYSTMVLLSPVLKIPVELEKDITVIEFPLPDSKELGLLLDRIITEVTRSHNVRIQVDPPTREAILHSALGLTLKEAENVFAKVLVQDSALTPDDVPVILSEKKQIVRKSGLLEYHETEEKMSDVGGLENLKEWLNVRGLAFSEKAREFGLPAPKGILLLGVQGCGKSLCAKAVSTLWQLPLLRLDVGKIFSSLVGSSEENVRRAIQVAESVAPAILWVDEIEKAFSGVQSSSFSDAGTMARVFGSFITWLQEKKAPVFVVATANNIQMLPPELMRKGRFDEIFFVDLPHVNERREIFRIHLQKRKRTPDNFNLELLSRASEGSSGAEIEQVIVSSLYEAFYKQCELSTDIVIKSISETVPLSKTMSEEVERIRNWSEGRARKASKEDPLTAPVRERRLEIK